MVYTAPAYPLPDYALRVIDALESAGYEAWAVGGWVRDALLAKPSHDVDVCTNALWTETKRVLEAEGIEVHETGTAHGTVTAVVDGLPIETTTYRVERGYSDHRHPDEVVFVRDVADDLGRRDFTINAMAYHPERGLLDPYGGRNDLEAGVIRAVGDPAERFSEDALRVLRAVRFACRMNFEIEEETLKALRIAAPALSDISQERIGSELDGILATGRAGMAMLAYCEVFCAAVPEFQACLGFDQRSIYHVWDVYAHIAHVTAMVEPFAGGLASPCLRWAAFLHDIAKPLTLTIDEAGFGHFYGHPEEGAKLAKHIMKRLALPAETIQASCALIAMHDFVTIPTTRSLRRALVRLNKWAPGRAETLFFELLNLRRADACAKDKDCAGFAYWLDQVEAVLRRELRAKPVLSVHELAVDGRDVMTYCGIEPGRKVGELLGSLLEKITDDELENTRDALLAELERMTR